MEPGDEPPSEFAREEVAPPASPRPSLGRILFHVALLVATAFTTTAMGTLLAIGEALPAVDDPLTALTAILQAVTSDAVYVLSGLIFSFTLLTILGAHEIGHYVVCRYYGIDASLPYFLPAPPPILIGTFGAFIRIRSPFMTRRALFDVGVAGPIAGFCFAIPAALVGILFAVPAHHTETSGAIVFQDPLLFIILQNLFSLPPALEWNPIYFAAWIGMFATGLNLVPVGQLDGGHASFALLGQRGHRLLSLVFFAAVTGLATVSFLRYGSPVWFLYVVLLGILLFAKHPPTLEFEPEIGRERRLVAAIVVAIFVLTFMPFPITVE